MGIIGWPFIARLLSFAVGSWLGNGGGNNGDVGETTGGRFNVEMIDTGYLEDTVWSSSVKSGDGSLRPYCTVSGGESKLSSESTCRPLSCEAEGLL